MSVQDGIAIAAAAVAAAYVARRAWRRLAGGGGCHCSSAEASRGRSKTEDMSPKYRPIVRLIVGATVGAKEPAAPDAAGTGNSEVRQ